MTYQRFSRRNLLALCALLTACGGGGGDSGNEQKPATIPSTATGITFFTEPNVPLLLRYTPEGSPMTTLYGQKSQDGTAISVDGIYFGNGGAGEASARLDANGRPTSVNLADGSVMTFDWQSTSGFVATVVRPDLTRANASLTIPASSATTGIVGTPA